MAGTCPGPCNGNKTYRVAESQEAPCPVCHGTGDAPAGRRILERIEVEALSGGRVRLVSPRLGAFEGTDVAALLEQAAGEDRRRRPAQAKPQTPAPARR